MLQARSPRNVCHTLGSFSHNLIHQRRMGKIFKAPSPDWPTLSFLSLHKSLFYYGTLMPSLIVTQINQNVVLPRVFDWREMDTDMNTVQVIFIISKRCVIPQTQRFIGNWVWISHIYVTVYRSLHLKHDTSRSHLLRATNKPDCLILLIKTMVGFLVSRGSVFLTRHKPT